MSRNHPGPVIFASIVGVVGAALLAAVWFLGNRGQTSATSPAEEQVIRIGYQKTSLYRHLFVADKKRFFEQRGLNVELVPFSSGNQIMNALLSGDIAIAGLTNMEVALRIETQEQNQFEFINFQVWTNEAFPDYVLDCTPDRTIDGLDRLVGKRLGRHPGSAVSAFANALLNTNGVDVSSVTQLELEPRLMRDAVAARQVDALYAMDPVATMLVRSGSCTVMVQHPLGQLIEGPLPISGTAVSRKFFGEQPWQAREIIAAFDAAIDFQSNPSNATEVAAIVAKYTEIDPVTAAALRPSVYWKSTEIEVEAVTNLAVRFVELGISKSPVSGESMTLTPAAIAALSER